MKKILLCIGILSLCAACVQDAVQDPVLPSGQSVEVSVSLTVEAEATGSGFTVPRPQEGAQTPQTPHAPQGLHAPQPSEEPGTRAVNDPDDPTNSAATEIANLWIVQFNGTTDDASLIGATYIPDYGTWNKSTKLIASSAPNTLVFLANTCAETLTFPLGWTLADLKSLAKRVGTQADLFGRDGEPVENQTFPNDGDYHLMLNGTTDLTIQSGTAVECTLRRNVARIDFNVQVKADAGVTVESVELRSVPAVSYYLTGALPAEFPVAGTFQTVNFERPAAIVAEADGSTTYRFYTPVNQRGEVANANEATKNQFAPNNATYAFVQAHYTENGLRMPVSYTFFLGADLVDDFNLMPNRLYTYNVAIRSKGDAATDTRIDDWGTVHFNAATVEPSNSYILNPAPIDDYKREFRFPVSRVDEFWGNVGYENQPNYLLGTSVPWTVEVVWADFNWSAEGVVLSKPSGNGSADYFALQVPRGISGNMVVGIRQSGTNYLWSWHLWITDYRPDEASKIDPEPDRYVYAVSGGEIHRYEGANWQAGGLYEESFIMDRNLGALSTAYVGLGRGSIYYQFGRKDPLPGSYTVYLTDGTTKNAVGQTYSVTNDIEKLRSSIIYSINHPLTFITNSGSKVPDGSTVYCWTYDNPYNPAVWSGNSNIIWQDPNRRYSTDDPLPKSIFDPCPPGWRLPRNGVWSDFRNNNAAKPTTNANGGTDPLRGFAPYAANTSTAGLRYWPYPETGSDMVTDEIYYPASGSRYNGSGAMSSVGSNGYYWSSSPFNQSSGYYLIFYSANVGPSNNYYRALGFPARCVRE